METLQDLINTLEKRKDKTAISFKSNDKLEQKSFKELYNYINTYSKALLQTGLNPGDKVALFADNLSIWIELSLGINNAGLVDVPRASDITTDEINYILEHSGSKIAIAQTLDLVDKIKSKPHKDLELILSIEESKNVKNIKDLNKLAKKYKNDLPKVDEDMLASIIYTSGTTDVPKGVELTHKNLVSNIISVGIVLKECGINDHDKFMSILPAWHSFERMAKYIALDFGIETFYTTQGSVLTDLAEQKPTIMASVPRIWELVYNNLMKEIKKLPGFKKKLIEKAIEISIDYSKRSAGPIKLLQSPIHNFVDKNVYSKLREKLGGNFRFAVSGGGALPPDIDDLFFAGKIDILEGYGLSETSPVVSARTSGWNINELHTAGKLIPGVEGKIIDSETGEKLPVEEEGILYVKGPNVMRGYHKMFEETRKILQDEWLNTGDLAYFDKNKNLIITGRYKNIIVLSNGENINPAPLEKALCQSKYIDSSLVIGQDWKKLGALIVPDYDSLERYCKDNDIEYYKEILKDKKIRDLYKNEIRKYVNREKKFKQYESIRGFDFVDPFSIENGELTRTLKPKTRIIVENNKNLIEKIRTNTLN